MKLSTILFAIGATSVIALPQYDEDPTSSAAPGKPTHPASRPGDLPSFTLGHPSGRPTPPGVPSGRPSAPGVPSGRPSAPGVPSGRPSAPGVPSGRPSAPGTPSGRPTPPGTPSGRPTPPASPSFSFSVRPSKTVKPHPSWTAPPKPTSTDDDDDDDDWWKST